MIILFINKGPSSTQKFFPSNNLYKSSDNLNTDKNHNSENNTANNINNTRKNNSSDSNFENMENLVIQDSRFNASSIKHNYPNEEFLSPIKDNLNKENSIEHRNKKNLDIEDIETLIENKRSQLDIKIYDMVTKSQIEEKKIEEKYNLEQDQEEKSKLLNNLEEEIKRNENAILNMKE